MKNIAERIESSLHVHELCIVLELCWRELLKVLKVTRVFYRTYEHILGTVLNLMKRIAENIESNESFRSLHVQLHV